MKKTMITAAVVLAAAATLLTMAFIGNTQDNNPVRFMLMSGETGEESVRGDSRRSETHKHIIKLDTHTGETWYWRQTSRSGEWEWSK